MTDLYMADVNEFHVVSDAAAYAGWSPAIILRAHNGMREDHSYATSRTAVQAEPGIRIVGHYGYVMAGIDAGQQGRDFANIITHRGGLPPGHFISWDIEEGTGDQAARAMAWLAAAHGILHEQAAADFGYSGAYFWGSHLRSVGNVHRWIAAYGPQPAMSQTLWQFTDKQPVPGVDGPCDCSIFHGTADDFLSLIAPPVVAPPAPAPRPIPGENMRVLSVNVGTDSLGNGWADIDLAGSRMTGAPPDVLAAEPGKPAPGPDGARYDKVHACRTIGAPAGKQRIQVTGGAPNAVYGVELQVAP